MTPEQEDRIYAALEAWAAEASRDSPPAEAVRALAGRVRRVEAENALLRSRVAELERIERATGL